MADALRKAGLLNKQQERELSAHDDMARAEEQAQIQKLAQARPAPRTQHEAKEG